jgi:hypothetical protein
MRLSVRPGEELVHWRIAVRRRAVDAVAGLDHIGVGFGVVVGTRS